MAQLSPDSTEFLYIEDLADAAYFLMLNYDSGDIINVGAAEHLTIAELAALVSEVVAYGGQIVFGASKPEGPPRKLIDVSRSSSLGWCARTDLREDLGRTYQWFLENVAAS